ncbi:hypothetical protein GIS00_21235 [Nakamurella sp. YIM 132087]|uniref:Uncharacterized protein n=1 Tax=Nakamurella alba TaxID=2665158 RepID=A0A7K1FUF6_9ACTN|nr:hypothetical protein [Nakamurella alba]MTD16464.1 hypothetical protein [Nakamurella alba]
MTSGPATGLRPVVVPVPRPDVLGSLFVVLGGVMGLLQLALSWTYVVAGVGLPGSATAPNGWGIYITMRAGSTVSASWAIGGYAVIGVGIAGAALVLLGLAMLAPLDHRPFGLAGLVLSLAAMGAAGWWLARSAQLMGQNLSALFANAGPGWYLFLIGGAIALVGSVKALASG